VADLGRPEEIGRVFAGFQQYLYLEKEAAVRALILGFASMAAVGVCQTPAALLAQERPPAGIRASTVAKAIVRTPQLCRPDLYLGRL
jgi:hypothetical protein